MYTNRNDRVLNICMSMIRPTPDHYRSCSFTHPSQVFPRRKQVQSLKHVDLFLQINESLGSFRSTTSSSTRTTFPVAHVSAHVMAGISTETRTPCFCTGRNFHQISNRRERVKRWHLDKMATINEEQAAEIGIELEAHDKRELFIWKPTHERFL